MTLFQDRTGAVRATVRGNGDGGLAIDPERGEADSWRTGATFVDRIPAHQSTPTGQPAQPRVVMTQRRRRMRRERRSVLRLVVDGQPDEAPEYVATLLDLVEEHGPALDRWWRSAARGRLELRWEVWGSGRHVRLHRLPGALHCRVQRAPEPTWDEVDPAASALDDLRVALDAVAGHVRGVPPLLTDPPHAGPAALDAECPPPQARGPWSVGLGHGDRRLLLGKERV